MFGAGFPEFLTEQLGASSLMKFQGLHGKVRKSKSRPEDAFRDLGESPLALLRHSWVPFSLILALPRGPWNCAKLAQEKPSLKMSPAWMSAYWSTGQMGPGSSWLHLVLPGTPWLLLTIPLAASPRIRFKGSP